MRVKNWVQAIEEKYPFLKVIDIPIKVRSKTVLTFMKEGFSDPFKRTADCVFHQGQTAHPGEVKKPFSYYFDLAKQKIPDLICLNPECHKNAGSVLRWYGHGVEFSRSLWDIAMNSGLTKSQAGIKRFNKQTHDLLIEKAKQTKKLKLMGELQSFLIHHPDLSVDIGVKDFKSKTQVTWTDIVTGKQWKASFTFLKQREKTNTPLDLSDWRERQAQTLKKSLNEPELLNAKAIARVAKTKIKSPHLTCLTPKTLADPHSRALWVDNRTGEQFERSYHHVFYRTDQPPSTVTERMKQTWMKNFGADNPNKCPEIVRKGNLKSAETHKFIHWETGEILCAKGSYEIGVLGWLNHYKIPFKWQIPFTTDQNKLFIVDLYLVKENKYVEIKGWVGRNKDVFTPKWEWFTKHNPTAELWTLPVLIEKGILRPGRKGAVFREGYCPPVSL